MQAGKAVEEGGFPAVGIADNGDAGFVGLNTVAFDVTPDALQNACPCAGAFVVP